MGCGACFFAEESEMRMGKARQGNTVSRHAHGAPAARSLRVGKVFPAYGGKPSKLFLLLSRNRIALPHYW